MNPGHPPTDIAASKFTADKRRNRMIEGHFYKKRREKIMLDYSKIKFY